MKKFVMQDGTVCYTAPPERRRLGLEWSEWRALGQMAAMLAVAVALSWLVGTP